MRQMQWYQLDFLGLLICWSGWYSWTIFKNSALQYFSPFDNIRPNTPGLYVTVYKCFELDIISNVYSSDALYTLTIQINWIFLSLMLSQLIAISCFLAHLFLDSSVCTAVGSYAWSVDFFAPCRPSHRCLNVCWFHVVQYVFKDKTLWIRSVVLSCDIGNYYPGS